MNKVLITGGNGMVGRNFLEIFSPQHYHIIAPTSKTVDLRDYQKTYNFLKETRPDIVIHLAALVGGIHANMEEPQKFLVENLEIGKNTILSSYNSGVKKFINVTSSCIYPKDAPNPLKEEHILTGKLEPTNESYALAKLITLKLCNNINQMDKNFQYKTIFPCNLYGKWDSYDDDKSHMVAAVIRKIDEAKKNNKKTIYIWGDGTVRREFMYAKDLADFLVFALHNFEKIPENLNVGVGYDHTINDYYKYIAQIIGYKNTLKHDLSKPQGMKQRLLDINKLKEIGWTSKTPLLDGLKKTYQFYLKHKL